MKKNLLIVFLFLQTLNVFCQGYTLNLEEKKGTGAIDFYYNTLSRIKDGVTYNNYTEFKVTFTDLSVLPDYTGFALYVHSAFSSLEAEYGAIDIDLTEIKISTSDDNGGICVINAPLSLTPLSICSWATLPDDIEHTATIKISYSCGELTNRDSDYFSTMLVFELKTYIGIP